MNDSDSSRGSSLRLITSSQNVTLKLCRKIALGKDKRYFLAEGEKTIETLLACLPSQLHAILMREDAYYRDCYPRHRRNVQIVDAQLWSSITTLRSPSPVLAVFERSAIALAQLDTKKDVLLLDCLQDPGNVGALIRSAAASNWQQVICLDGTADPYNIKAVRASAGAIGAVRLSHGNSFEESLSFLRDNKYTLLNTVIGSSTSQLASLVREERQRCLILGSEGQGSREQWRYASDLHPVSLPMMHPLVESLNVAVAGSMLLYKLHDLL